MASVGKVRVRLFARLADVAGTRSTEVELGEGLTAGDAYRLLCREHPAMGGLEGSLMYAVNAEYVAPDHPLRAGDELALIPPVSGGGPHSALSTQHSGTDTHVL
jgi:molybdopterin converting factor subunit 1